MSAGRFRFDAGVGWLRKEVVNHGVDPAVRGRVAREVARDDGNLDARQGRIPWGFVDFPIYGLSKPVTRPYPPLYLGGRPAIFRRIAQLDAGWIAIVHQWTF